MTCDGKEAEWLTGLHYHMRSEVKKAGDRVLASANVFLNRLSCTHSIQFPQSMYEVVSCGRLYVYIHCMRFSNFQSLSRCDPRFGGLPRWWLASKLSQPRVQRVQPHLEQRTDLAGTQNRVAWVALGKAASRFHHLQGPSLDLLIFCATKSRFQQPSTTAA